jgi:hypothetical protein
MWLKDDGYVITSAHEPLSFVRRSGGTNIHSDENYDNLHTEETVLKLKEMGLTLFRFHFHKGMGYEVEREDRERTREFIKLCHKHGIKVQLYIQFGTLMPETYRAEEPDYDNWIKRDEHGKPITLLYTHQNFRNHPCLNRPGYWEHLKKIVKEAIIDCKADAIGFDNVSGAEEPEVCHCDACKKAFVDFLKLRYPTEEAAKARFGHATLDYITPPVWNYYNNHFNLTEIKNPVIQEWMEFRAASLKRRVDELYALCKSLDLNVFVEINAFRQTGQNTTFHTGLYVDDLSSGCDGFWSEMEPQPGYKNGVLSHKVRAYKNTASLNKLLFTGHPWDGSRCTLKKYILAMCESMVFQYGSINCISLLKNYKPIENTNLPHMPLWNFSRANRDIYLANPVPFVHVYESRASLSNSNFESHYANILMQQVLLREKIPYAILHNLNNINNCRTIILPGTMCLSEGEINKLVKFVEGGGGLVLTGNAGDYDELYCGWDDQSLKAKLGISDKCAPYLTNISLGRVASLPRVASKHDFNTYDWAYRAFEQAQLWVKHHSWEAPDNMREIADTIRWTLKNELPVIVNAPEAVVCELAQNGNNLYLHLLNYDNDNTAEAITVTFPQKIKSASLLIPETGDSKELKISSANAVIIDKLDTYAIIKVTIWEFPSIPVC